MLHILCPVREAQRVEQGANARQVAADLDDRRRVCFGQARAQHVVGQRPGQDGQHIGQRRQRRARHGGARRQ